MSVALPEVVERFVSDPKNCTVLMFAVPFVAAIVYSWMKGSKCKKCGNAMPHEICQSCGYTQLQISD